MQNKRYCLRNQYFIFFFLAFNKEVEFEQISQFGVADMERRVAGVDQQNRGVRGPALAACWRRGVCGPAQKELMAGYSDFGGL